MIDPKVLRNELDTVISKLKRKGFNFPKDKYLKLENERKNTQSLSEKYQQKRNTTAKSIGKAKAEGKDTKDILKEASILSDKVKNLEGELKELQEKIHTLLLNIPNIPLDSIPDGKDENNNVIIKKHGDIAKLNFKVKDHIELTEKHNAIDCKKGAEISGSRFTFLHGECALLHRALGQWMLDKHTQNGYTEVNPPVIVNKNALIGTGQLPKFEEDQFKINENSYLIATGEIPLTNLVANKIVKEEELPYKFCAQTLCFRQEAGSYGKDTKGMFRMHQFEKVELVHICTKEESKQQLNKLLQNAESILIDLKLPYQVVELCAGDTGFSACQTYDLEVWLPSQERFREVSSCSNTQDFQARRMLGRYKNKDNKIEYLHTLNGSGLAIGRTLIAVIENYQQEDGSIAIPEVLQKYMGGKKQILVNKEQK